MLQHGLLPKRLELGPYRKRTKHEIKPIAEELTDDDLMMLEEVTGSGLPLFPPVRSNKASNRKKTCVACLTSRSIGVAYRCLMCSEKRFRRLGAQVQPQRLTSDQFLMQQEQNSVVQREQRMIEEEALRTNAFYHIKH